jgi:hypothetical protein
MVAERLVKDPEERDQIGTINPTMDERSQRATLAIRPERPHELCGRWSHHPQKALDRLEHARHTPECQRGRAKAYDLAVVRPLVTPDNLNWIGRGVGIVEAGVQAVERGFEFGPVHSPDSKMRTLHENSAIKIGGQCVDS